MKNKKRILSSILVVVLLATLLTGCASGTLSRKVTNEKGQVVISVGDFPDPDTDKEAYDIKLMNVKKFEELHPNIKIEPVSWKYDPRTYMAKAEGKTLPTVYTVPLTESKKLMDMGYTADITNELKSRGFYNALNDFALQNISRDGKVYLLPNGNYDVGLIVNLNLYEKAGFVDEDGTPYQPIDWDDLVRVAKVIKEKTGKAGFVFPTTEYNGGWRFCPVAWGFGAVLETQENGKWKATFDSQETVNALQFIKDLKWKHNVLPENTLINGTEVVKLCATGEAAICIGEADRVNEMVKYGLSLDKIGMLQLPSGPMKKVTMMGGTYMAIDKNSTPEQISAAMEWIEFGGNTVKLTDEIKESLKDKVELDIAENKIVGVEKLSPWNDDSEVENYKKQLQREFINVNPNHIKHYNDKSGMEYQAEEPIDAQALYTTLDACIQSVVTDKNADCAEILKKAASDFQKNNLDYAN